MRIATPDLVTNSYFPALAAEELGVFREEGLDAHVELLPSLDAVNALRDGTVDFVAGGAHTSCSRSPDGEARSWSSRCRKEPRGCWSCARTCRPGAVTSAP